MEVVCQDAFGSQFGPCEECSIACLTGMAPSFNSPQEVCSEPVWGEGVLTPNAWNLKGKPRHLRISGISFLETESPFYLLHNHES
jgi:hypothetical protein